MTSRTQIAVGVIASLIVFPFLLVYAQSEGEAQASATEDSAAAEQSDAEAPQDNSAPTAEPEQETEVEGDTAVDIPADQGEVGDDSGTAEEAASAEQPTTTPPVAEGSVPGEATTTEEVSTSEPVVSENATSASQTGTTTVETDVLLDSASTTATSTPPVEEPKPVEEPLVLQPGVMLSISGNTVSAAVTLQNLTCVACDKELPEVEVLVYYTPWYPNDGPVADYAEASVKIGWQAQSVGDLPVKATRDLSWSAEVPSGHYYFVVEVDPGNVNRAYRLFRSEFSI